MPWGNDRRPFIVLRFQLPTLSRPLTELGFAPRFECPLGGGNSAPAGAPVRNQLERQVWGAYAIHTNQE